MPNTNNPDRTLNAEEKELLEAFNLIESRNVKKEFKQSDHKDVLQYKDIEGTEFWVTETSDGRRYGIRKPTLATGVSGMHCFIDKREADTLSNGKVVSVHTCRYHYVIVEWA